MGESGLDIKQESEKTTIMGGGDIYMYVVQMNMCEIFKVGIPRTTIILLKKSWKANFGNCRNC